MVPVGGTNLCIYSPLKVSGGRGEYPSSLVHFIFETSLDNYGGDQQGAVAPHISDSFLSFLATAVG